MLEYYWVLRSVLRERPEVRRCLCRCRHCRIYFITDPRNAGREDLGCPFGCREAHRKRESTRRSVAYYREEEGKLKKRQLNSKRCRVVVPAGKRQEAEPGDASDASDARDARDARDVSGSPADPSPWSRALVEHVRMVSSLIERRRVSREEVVKMLGEVLRQHSMARRRRVDHLVAHLHQNPP